MLIEIVVAFGLLVVLWMILPSVGHELPISGGSRMDGED